MENKDLQQLLQSVISHWQESTQAYSDYMQNGKIFRHAERLRLHNTEVKNLLQSNLALFTPELKGDVEAIIEHYTIWTEKWDDLKAKINPAPDDEFVFENAHRFPKAAAQRLEAALKL